MSIRLSRGFATVPVTSPEQFFKLRSAAALTLGIIPFIIHSLSRKVFKAMAHLGDLVDKHGHAIMRQIVGILAVPTAAVMSGSAKLFAITQLFIWKHYVRKPEGDGANTRLAWYGADHLPWQDLQAITKAFFKPYDNALNAWSLKQWSRVEL